MRRRHLDLLSLWILPLLIARAMIPTGFMLSVGGGLPQLTFCPAGVYQLPGEQPSAHEESTPGASAHGGHAGHHDGGDEHQGHDAGGANSTACPYSLVAAAVSSDVPALRIPAGIVADEDFEFVSAPARGTGPIRADRIRGPPSLS